MINGLGYGTMPLSSSFSCSASATSSTATCSRTSSTTACRSGACTRMMPNPLDVGFAALGNDQAGQLLAARARPLSVRAGPRVDARAGRRARLRLSGRKISTTCGSARSARCRRRAELAEPAARGPTARRCDAKRWGRRVLGTQLASWAELRHDTLLYAKQSYTGGAGCEFPDAYVDPYPEFYARIGELAARGKELDRSRSISRAAWLVRLAAGLLRSARERRRNARADGRATAHGHALTPRSSWRSSTARSKSRWAAATAIGAEGWYSELFFEGLDAVTSRSDHRRRAHPADRRGGQHGGPRTARGDRHATPDGGQRRYLLRTARLRRARSRRTSSASRRTSSA